jgi:hypothetical protein
VIALILALGLLAQGAPGEQGAAAPGKQSATAPAKQGAVAPGVVTGQVQTREGMPAAAVRVAAIPAPPPQAAEGLNYYVPPPPTRVTQTDEQGRYRLTNLPPGRYLIAGGLIGVGTYHPSEPEALRAAVVTVGADAPATADIRMVTPIGARVSGRVTPPPATGSGEIAVLSGVTLAELAEVPVGADGQFTFGRVPAGRYLVSIFPTPPGFGSTAVAVQEAAVTTVDIKRPPTHAISGRVVATNGPIPNGLLALIADTSYVPIRINADGTFTAHAQSARHRFELSGVPIGYSLTSIQLGSQDISEGLTVGNADISGVTVTISAPNDLPRIRGAITGLTRTATVEMRGPIIGTLTSPIARDGAFEFPAVTPGLYYLRVPEAPELGTHQVVVGWQGTSVELTPPTK